ncbi:MAG: hypothetical protein LUC50_02915 [Ruminococcus sp.]|nr:hypothetical protein [Ruminococcus sp.]
MLAFVSIASETYDVLETYELQLEVDVLVDSIQTQGGALAARWAEAGMTIDDKDGSLVTVT